MRIISSLLLMVFLLACSSEPAPIHFGEDGCSYCRMTISDHRYGGELMTNKGKVYKYDSIECLAAYILENKPGSDDIQNIWTIDFNNPKAFIDAGQAWYIHSELLKSPMGLNLSAFKDKTLAESVENVYPGELVRWDEVKKIVQKKWLD